MRYIDSWLTGLGLDYIIPKLKESGINTPKKLAMLTLRDMYEVGKRTDINFSKCNFYLLLNLKSNKTYFAIHFVGVKDAEDRKKLYFLIQRLQTVFITGKYPLFIYKLNDCCRY